MNGDLDAATRPGTELDGPIASSGPLDGELRPGQRIGPFRLVRPLGQGGMGQVWLAEQLEPLARTVAIKLQKQRLQGGLAEAYFAIERQALAQLLHPYIAQIYDAGTLPDGALYFAMEYVDGLTLDAFLRQRRPTLDAVAELFIKLCQGIQHAHQRGLVHRDLKPGNVLVIEVGGQYIPKIIDFGVAIGVDPRSGVALGQRRAGTRAYMAPEQHQPDSAGIDVRADVYALGTMLAQAAGSALGVELEKQGSDRLRSLLGGPTDPPASGHAAEPPAGSAQLQRACRQIPAELRAIVLMAIASDRNQRYESAAALADDLDRWRHSRPVRAMAGGRWYAVRCFLRRYRLASAAAAAILLALVGGLVVALYGLQQARQQRALAEDRRERAEQLIGFMLGDFAEKLRQLGKLELLDGVSSKAMEYLGDPAIAGGSVEGALYRARSLRTLGEVQSARGRNAEARSAFEEAQAIVTRLATQVPDNADLLLEQGTLSYWLGFMSYQRRDLVSAERHWRGYQEHAAKLIALTSATGLGLLETSYAHNNLGTLAFERAEWAEAARHFERSIALKTDYLEDHPDDENAANNLSNAFSWLGRTREAQGELEKALSLYQRQLAGMERLSARSPDSRRLSYEAALARYWVAHAALIVGDQSLALQQLELAEPQLRALVEFDGEQLAWRRYWLSVRAELAWVRFLDGAGENTTVELQKVRAEIDMLQVTSPTNQMARRAVEVRLRLLLIEGKQAGSLEAIDELVNIAESVRAKEAIREATALLVSALTLRAMWFPARRSADLARARELIDGSGKTGAEHFLALVGRSRIHTVEGNIESAQRANEALARMGYRHPEHIRFTAAPDRGAVL